MRMLALSGDDCIVDNGTGKDAIIFVDNAGRGDVSE